MFGWIQHQYLIKVNVKGKVDNDTPITKNKDTGGGYSLYQCIKNGSFNVFKRISKKIVDDINDDIVVVFSAENYELNEYVVIDSFVIENFAFIIPKEDNCTIDELNKYVGKIALSELEKVEY